MTSTNMRLSPEIQEDAYLEYLSGSTYAKIAEDLGVSESTIKRLAKNANWQVRKKEDSSSVERKVEAILNTLLLRDADPVVKANILITVEQVLAAARAIDRGDLVAKSPSQLTSLLKHLDELTQDSRVKPVGSVSSTASTGTRRFADKPKIEIPTLPASRSVGLDSGMIGRVLGGD